MSNRALEAAQAAHRGTKLAWPIFEEGARWYDAELDSDAVVRAFWFAYMDDDGCCQPQEWELEQVRRGLSAARAAVKGESE